jgi:hypothetical protein
MVHPRDEIIYKKKLGRPLPLQQAGGKRFDHFQVYGSFVKIDERLGCVEFYTEHSTF